MAEGHGDEPTMRRRSRLTHGEVGKPQRRGGKRDERQPTLTEEENNSRRSRGENLAKLHVFFACDYLHYCMSINICP